MAQYPLLMNEVQSAMITSSAVACSNVIAGDDNHLEIIVMTIVTLTFITPTLYLLWFAR